MEWTTTTVDTGLGPVRVRSTGTGTPVVCSHPALVDGRYWEPLARALAGRVRLVLPDLPLGAQRTAVPDRTALTLHGVADALVAAAGAVVNDPYVLVGNDTGGAVAQLALAQAPRQVRGLVLLPSEVFDTCPPRGFGPLVPLLTGSRAGGRLLLRAFGWPPVLSRPGPLNDLTARGIPRRLVDDWLGPARRDDAVVDDLRHLIRSMRPEVTLGVLDALAAWRGPAHVLWYRRGLLFPARDGERIATHLQAWPVRWVDGARALVGWDAPDVVAAAVLDLAGPRGRRTPDVGAPHG